MASILMPPVDLSTIDPIFAEAVKNAYYASDSRFFLESPESFESQRNAILEKLRPYEDEEPVDIIEFIESDRYLGLAEFAFPAVYWILDMFYNPGRHFDDFRRSWKRKEYVFPGFGSLGLTKDQVETLWFRELVLYVGMRTAKSWATGISAVYECYKAVCKYPDPHTYYRDLDIAIAPGTMIYISTCATSATQAGETCGAAIMNFKNISPWFQRYIKRCIELGKMPDGRTPIYQEYSSSFTFNHKYIEVNSLHSRSGGLVGRARLMAILDEIAKMDESGGARDAGMIYNNLTAGTETFLNEGRVVSLSSPSHLTDMINVLFARCKYQFSSKEYDGRFTPLTQVGEEYIEPVDSMLGFHYPTWELNPRRPKSAFAIRMQKNPVETERDFGALPSAARYPFIRNIPKLRIIFDWDKSRRVESDPRLPSAVYEEDFFDENDHIDKIRYKLQDWIHFDDRFQHFMHFDAGLGKPSNFGIAVGHAEPCPHEYEDSKIVHILTVFDFIYHFEVDPLLGEVDVERVSNFIADELVPYIPGLRVSTDRWNSAQLIQRLRRKGISLRNLVVKDEDYEAFKNQLEYELINGYYYPQAYEEFRRLESDPRSGRITKGPNFTKDVADCLAAVTSQIIERGVHKAQPGRAARLGALQPGRSANSGKAAPGRSMGIGGFGRR